MTCRHPKAPASDGGAAITDYLVQISGDAGKTWATVADGVSPATSATVTGLTNSARYMFRVAAVNAAGTGTRSDSSAAFVPATFGGFSEFSAPTQMVTGTAVPISGRLFDQDSTAVDAIRVYRDADGNGVLDLTIDQLLHADPTPGDGFEWDTSTLASGVHRLFTAAMKGGSVVASTPLTVTAAQWWELSIGQTTHGKALYTATGELSTGLPQGVGKPVYVAPGTDINDAWIAAVNEHVSGTIEVHHNGKKLYEYAFGSAAFRVGLLGALATQVSNDPNAKNKFGITLPDDTKLIVLEDLTAAKSNDFDYDDQYWVVTWSPLLVDLDVDSDNTGTLDHTAHEDDIEEGTNDEGVIVRPGLIVPVGGGRVKMVANVPEGFTATLVFANGVDMVRVYAQQTSQPGQEEKPVLSKDKKTTTVVGGSAKTFWIEAFNPSESMADIAFTLTLHDNLGSSSTGSGSTGSAPSDTIRATAVEVDLDVDSDNNDRLNSPKRDLEEEDQEATTPKRIVVNDNDTDGDHVPDYADWSIADKRFTPLVLEIPAGLPLGMMQIHVSYAASDPTWVGADHGLPANSSTRPLRIWTKNASQQRNPASITAGGSFVPEGRVEALTTLGFTESIRTVELYVEGIRATAGVSKPISVQLIVGDRVSSIDLVNVVVVSNTLVIGIDGTDTRPWLTGPNAKRPNGLWNSHVRNLIAAVEPYAMKIYRLGPNTMGTDSDDIQRDVVARANEIIRDAGGGTKVALVGWSRGAMIALWAANELSGQAAQVGGQQRTVEFVGLYDPVDMATDIPSDEHVRGNNAARIQPGIRRVTIVGAAETPNNNVDYPVGLPSYWTGLILTPDPVFVRMSQNDRITALGSATVIELKEYDASHGAIGGCPGYNVHLVSVPDGRYNYAVDRQNSIRSDKDIRNGMRAAGLDFVPDRDEDWYGFPTTRPVLLK